MLVTPGSERVNDHDTFKIYHINLKEHHPLISAALEKVSPLGAKILTSA